MSKLQHVTHTTKDGKQVIIRSATKTDVSDLVKCFDENLANGEGLVSQPGELDSTEPAIRKWILDSLENPSYIILVAEHQGSIVANIAFQSGKRKRISHTGDFQIVILPKWRGLGIGSLLLDTFIRWAIDNKSVEKVNLRVLASNSRAIALYKKYGFKEEGRCIREVKYENGTYCDEILMSRFVV